MKKGPIIAIVVFGLATLFLYLAPVSPEIKDIAELEQKHTDTENVENADLDAKVEEAIQIIQNTKSGAPMRGITLLREVLAEKPDHVKANFWLGEFSVMSGQLDKAVLRYEKVLEVDPSHHVAVIKLYDVFLQLNESEKAKNVLLTFLKANPKGEGREEIENILNHI